MNKILKSGLCCLFIAATIASSQVFAGGNLPTICGTIAKKNSKYYIIDVNDNNRTYELRTNGKEIKEIIETNVGNRECVAGSIQNYVITVLTI